MRSSRRQTRALWGFLFLCLCGAVVYGVQVWKPQQVYAATTLEMEERADHYVDSMNVWATEESLRKARQFVEEYASRKDADPQVSIVLQAKLNDILHLVAARVDKYNEFLEKARTFPLVSSLDEVEAFDAAVKAALVNWHQEERDKFQRLWASRRDLVFRSLKTDTIEVRLETYPEMAIAYLDGKDIGYTPLKIKGLYRGEHMLTFEKKGYRTVHFPLFVEDDGQYDLGIIYLPKESGEESDDVSGEARSSQWRPE